MLITMIINQFSNILYLQCILKILINIWLKFSNFLFKLLKFKLFYKISPIRNLLTLFDLLFWCFNVKSQSK